MKTKEKSKRISGFMDKNINIGIIGFGRIVELEHLPIIKSLPGLQVAGIYDLTESRRDLAQRRGFRVFDSHDDLLASGCELVLVATTPDSHYELAEKCLAAGSHVLIEKPVTTSYDQALLLKKAAEQSGKTFTVFYSRRFDPDYQWVENMIKSGELGRILFIERKYQMYGDGTSFGVKSFNPAWRVTRSMGGGALLDWGVHLIDQLVHLQLGEVEKVVSCLHQFPGAAGDTEDYVHAQLVLDNGIVFSLTVNFRSHLNSPLWVVGGEQKTLVIRDSGEALIYETRKEPVLSAIGARPRMAGKAIYTGIIDQLTCGGPQPIAMDEILAGMHWLDRIRNAAV
jgi:scyllo-inositol 2-dehydrogenase (NADP+)